MAFWGDRRLMQGISEATQGLTTTRHGTPVVDEATMMTTRKGVFAGGHNVAGASTVILALGHGREAAQAIGAYLHEQSRMKQKVQP
ncbi:MAG TPA: hypothetical protein VKE50_00160 [Thermoanaerobaculia bacterium]|nr:hypothetical protein [Thermoanaerobaculia bacterium]